MSRFAAHGPIEPCTVVDPVTGRPILMAPERQQRPMHTGQNQVERPCPFCEGNEAETPPEVDAERQAGSHPDAPGWIARAIPNKYPANHHHEVFAEGPTHFERPCDLDASTWARAVSLWQRRIAALEQLSDVACAYFFKNVGALAGASIAHNHSQVLGLAALPPRLELERARQRMLGHCPWCATVATAAQEQRLVHRSERFAILSPEPPKMPFESWLLPIDCESDFLAVDATSLGQALRIWFQAIDRGLHRPAYNLWLHRVPPDLLDGETFHWHFELQPRTGQLAGLELGGDMYINSVPAQLTAERLRAGLAP